MNLREKSIHKLVRMTQGRVWASVEPLGQIVVRYSQSSSPTYALLKADQQNGGGVCAALSAHWMHQASRGGSLMDDLIRNDGGLDAGLFAQVANLQTRSILGADQDRIIYGELTNQFGLRALPTRDREGGNPSAAELAEAISGNTRGIVLYRYISFVGRGGGHAVAAAVTDNDITYFDPNYGQFHFDSLDRFRQWFPRYWSRSQYDLGLSKSYSVESYIPQN